MEIIHAKHYPDIQMPNTYFQFKQFIIHQESTAMKVCTDACLFGAWVVAKICKKYERKNESLRMLDIGAGTGLLSLMVAQECDFRIDAIEIEPDAFEQAEKNIQASPWKDRITLIQGDIREHVSLAAAGKLKTYDLVISNPPFYEDSLKSGKLEKNMAKHDSSLTVDELLAACVSCVKPGGGFAVMLPFFRRDEFLEKATALGFVTREELLVRQSPKHHFFRAMIYLENNPPDTKQPIATEELTIKEVHHSYSLPFVHYLQPYYLSL